VSKGIDLGATQIAILWSDGSKATGSAGAQCGRVVARRQHQAHARHAVDQSAHQRRMPS